jgi:hypothetical protein
MTTVQKVNIPKSCSQLWQQMTPENGGRHCESCAKTVVDFTALSNQQILNYLSAKNHLCGRFGDDQLNDLNRYLSETHPAGFSWKHLSLAVAMFGFLPFAKAQERAKVFTETHPVKTKTGIKRTQSTNHYKNLDSLICKSASIDEIKFEPEYPRVLLDEDLQVYEPGLSATVGGVVVGYSFPRSFWYHIKWKIKSIFAR